MTPALRANSLVVALLLFTGCKSAPAVKPTDSVSPLMLLESSLGADVVQPATAFPEGSWVSDYGVVEKDRIVATLVRRQEATDRFNATMKITEGPDPQRPAREQFIRLENDGNLVMTAVIEHKDNAVSFFNPPLVVMYASLSPGDSRTQTVDMRVMNLKNPSQQREHGKATQTIEYSGNQRIRTPRGEFAAQRFITTFKADLQLAEATDQTTTFAVHGIGAVAEQTVSEIKALGLLGGKKSRTMVMMPSATSPGAGRASER